MKSGPAEGGENAVLQNHLRGTSAVAHGQAHRRVAVEVAPREVSALHQQLVHAVRLVLHRGKHQRRATVLVLQKQKKMFIR